MKETLSPSKREELLRRVHLAVQLLSHNLEHLQAAPPGDSRADKAACEILLLCWELKRNQDFMAQAAGTVDKILDVVEARLTGQSFLQGLIWRPSRVSMLSMGSSMLHELGRHNPLFTRVARTAWQSSFKESLEQSPFQLLETEWSSAMFGTNISLDILENSLLFRKPFPQMMAADDAYAFTHSIFYTTHFGRSDPPALVNCQDVWDVVNSGILWSLVCFDFDLLGEFLLSALFYKMPYSPAMQLGMHTLLAAWDEFGFIPDRNIDIPDNHEQVQPKEIFYSIYHANLVAAFLMSEVLIRDLAMDDPVSPISLSSRSLEQIQAKLTIWLQGREIVTTNQAYPSQNGTELLRAILGPKVAKRVIHALPESTLSDPDSDLLISYGFVYQDVNAIFAGVNASAKRGEPSWTLVCALEWLMMFHEVVTAVEKHDSPMAMRIGALLTSMGDLRPEHVIHS